MEGVRPLGLLVGRRRRGREKSRHGQNGGCRGTSGGVDLGVGRSQSAGKTSMGANMRDKEGVRTSQNKLLNLRKEAKGCCGRFNNVGTVCVEIKKRGYQGKGLENSKELNMLSGGEICGKCSDGAINRDGCSP